MGSPVSDLVSGGELWRGAVAGLVATVGVELAHRRLRPGSRPRRTGRWAWTGPALSALAAFAAYTCVPDTERALLVVGATGGAAAAAVLLRRPWPVGALAVTAALVWVALEDGPPRDSALVGTLCIAVLHVVLQHRAVVAPRVGPAIVALGAVAMGLAARVAGRGDGVVRPVLLAVGLVLVTVGFGRLTDRESEPA